MMSVRFHHKHPLAFTACFLVLGAILGKHTIAFIAAAGTILLLTKRYVGANTCYQLWLWLWAF